jgi:hypothetical protein
LEDGAERAVESARSVPQQQVRPALRPLPSAGAWRKRLLMTAFTVASAKREAHPTSHHNCRDAVIVVVVAHHCYPARNFDPFLDCGPRGGQVGREALTGAAGLSEDARLASALAKIRSG